ncbi:MAG: LuxR C-terminal-related transcriptional regulator [Pseudonocardiales bacterium]
MSWSSNTVRVHISRICEKLRVRSRAALGARLAEEDHNS